VNSNNKNAVEQGVLPLVRFVEQTALPIEVVAKQKSLLGAVNLCITESGLEDKEIYLALGIDAGHFSNLRKGKGNFPTDKLNDLCDLCGNEAPLQWWANSRGYGLVMLKSEAERRAEEAERRAKDAEDKLKFLTLVMQGKAVA
jgi:predicted XRE-type DNA-binding protein